MKYKVINPNKYSGCFLGSAIGDALGAPFEGGFPPVLGKMSPQ